VTEQTGPAERPDRVVIISHADYVRIKDDHPELLHDDRATLVPYPLIGEWVEDRELVVAGPRPDTVLVRDPVGGRGYLVAEQAEHVLALAQAHAFNRVCQLLGATSVRIVEYDSRDERTAMSNRLSAGVTAMKRTASAAKRGLSSDIAYDSASELRRYVETNGRWRGGEADIAAAREALSGFDDTSGALANLVDMRAATNQLHDYRVHVDFFHDVRRQLDLVVELVASLRLALGRKRPGVLEAKLHNRFRLTRERARHESFLVEVRFDDPSPPDAASADG
jgi:hypothetical protein